jgi:hypothetical protein
MYLSWKAFERRQSFWDLMEALFIDSINRHVRAAEKAHIVERADLYNYGRKSLRPRGRVSAAFSAELSSDRLWEVTARERLGRSLGVGESGYRHCHEYIRRTARDVLTFPAMALTFHRGLALGNVAQCAAITTTFQLHRNPPARTGHFSCSGAILFCYRHITDHASFGTVLKALIEEESGDGTNSNFARLISSGTRNQFFGD